MQSSRTVSAVLVCSLLAAVTAARAADFGSVREAHAAWQSASNAAARQAAAAWIEARAAQTVQANEVGDALRYAGRVALAEGSGERFLALCARRAADGTPDVRQAAVLQQAEWLVSASNQTAAIDALAAHLARTDLTANHRMTAAKAAAALLTAEPGRAAEAGAVLGEAMDAVTTNEVASFAELAHARAVLRRDTLRDLPGAEADTRRVLSFGDACPPAIFAPAVDRLAAILTETGRTGEVVRALLLLPPHPTALPSGIARKLIDSSAPAAALESAVAQLRGRIPRADSAPEMQTRIERVQPELIELLLALGRPDEAARECRVYAFCATDRAYPQAIELAARCLKTIDGNLGRANSLLAFHRDGAADAPAAAAPANELLALSPLDELLAVSPLDDAARRAVAAELAATPANVGAWRRRAMLLLWLDRPVEALDAARAAFACCPLTTTDIQACADAITRPMLVATRDVRQAQLLVDYLLLGRAGPDRRAGTPDDLADPFPEARRRLILGAAPPAP